MDNNQQENKGFSRRNFVKGAGLVGMSAFSASMLAACSSSSDDSSESSESALVETSGYSTTGDWLGEAPRISDDEIVETVDCDVVVCGGGHASIQAALAAAEGGARASW